MAKSTRIDLIKIAGALTLAGVFFWLFVPPAAEVLTRPHTVAAGPRTLVVVSTQGGASGHELHAHITGSIGNDITFWMSLRTLDEAQTDYEQVDFQVTFFGPTREGTVICQDEPAAPAHWDDLGAGAQAAFRIDATSTGRGAHPRGTAAPDPISESFPQWSGTISTVPRMSSDQDRDRAALTCTIPATWVWTAGSKRITALLPQVNYNAINAITDFQWDLVGTTSIERDPAWVLTESYPAATVDAYSIDQTLNQFWLGEVGEMYNLGYTTQPDLLFTARGTGEDDAKILTLAALALGIAGSLVVAALARIVDVTGQLVRAVRGTDGR